MNSRQKGCRGEREWAHFLTDAGFPSRRGQQFAGGTDSPDVISPTLPDVHWEVKRTENGNPYIWLAQAVRDAGQGKSPVVAHKRNGKDWIVILPAKDFCSMLLDSEWHAPEAMEL